MLKLQFVDGSRESFWLAQKKLTVGADPSNDLVIKDPKVAPFHLEIHKHEEDYYVVQCEEQRILINKIPIKRSTTPVHADDTILIGSTELRFIEPKGQGQAKASNQQKTWGLEIKASWSKQSVFPIHGVTTIGRDDDCDITVPVSHLSRKHATLEVVGDSILVKDLQSTNGTHLNGARVTEAYAKAGDKLKFDVVTFTVIGPDEKATDKTVVRQSATSNAAKTQPRPKQPPKPRDEPSQAQALKKIQLSDLPPPEKNYQKLYQILAILGVSVVIAIGVIYLIS